MGTSKKHLVLGGGQWVLAFCCRKVGALIIIVNSLFCIGKIRRIGHSVFYPRRRDVLTFRPFHFLEGKKTMDVERKWPKIADINLQIPKRCHAIWMVHWCRCNLLMTYHQQQHEINFQAQRVQRRDFESLPSTGKPMIFYQIPGPKFFFDL